MKPALRRVLFFGAAAWMLLSPAYVQVFGGSGSHVRAWRMFHLRGAGICSARYFAGGQRIDRYALFGLDRRTAPPEFRRLTNEAQAKAMGRRICARLGPGAAVTLELRCSDLAGFHPAGDPGANLCE